MLFRLFCQKLYCTNSYLNLQFISIGECDCIYVNTMMFLKNTIALSTEVRDNDTTSSSFIVQDYFSCPSFIVFPYEAEICFFQFL